MFFEIALALMFGPGATHLGTDAYLASSVLAAVTEAESELNAGAAMSEDSMVAPANAATTRIVIPLLLFISTP